MSAYMDKFGRLHTLYASLQFIFRMRQTLGLLHSHAEILQDVLNLRLSLKSQVRELFYRLVPRNRDLLSCESTLWD